MMVSQFYKSTLETDLNTACKNLTIILNNVKVTLANIANNQEYFMQLNLKKDKFCTLTLIRDIYVYKRNDIFYHNNAR